MLLSPSSEILADAVRKCMLFPRCDFSIMHALSSGWSWEKEKAIGRNFLLLLILKFSASSLADIEPSESHVSMIAGLRSVSWLRPMLEPCAKDPCL